MNEYEHRMDTLEDRLLFMMREYEDQLENIGEDQLTFTPVKNHGGVPFTISFNPETKKMCLKTTDGKKYNVTFIMEE